jgi:hypothetical protein
VHTKKGPRRPRWAAAFLRALAAVPNVSNAARAANVSRRMAYKHRESDPEFAAAWDEALETSVDELVGECYRRAVEGTEKPVFHKGKVCGHIREYSDTLAIFLLKCHRPKVYRERYEHSVEVPAIDPGVNELIVKIYGEDSVLSDSDLDSLGGIARKLAGDDPAGARHALPRPRRLID